MTSSHLATNEGDSQVTLPAHLASERLNAPSRQDRFFANFGADLEGHNKNRATVRSANISVSVIEDDVKPTMNNKAAIDSSTHCATILR